MIRDQLNLISLVWTSGSALVPATELMHSNADMPIRSMADIYNYVLLE